ncbi:hypothetical protein, partial [Azospirillum sp. A39]|uniref:hypothetical protein n=1 Tax=Azospirillum sp. A39 TaxID=3462279 RepID=UPI004045AAD4
MPAAVTGSGAGTFMAVKWPKVWFYYAADATAAASVQPAGSTLYRIANRNGSIPIANVPKGTTVKLWG